MGIINETIERLLTVEYYLDQLPNASYRKPLSVLSGSSIGEHTRHIIEFYECLLLQEEGGIINYDLRERRKDLQEKVSIAIHTISGIRNWLCSQPAGHDRILTLVHHTIDGDSMEVMTTLQRELIYNLEHLIHHLALVKIGLGILYPHLKLPAGFGVAASTIKFRSHKVSLS